MPEVPLNPASKPDAIEAGRRLFAQQCEFQRGVLELDQMPDAILPEITFAGRSNVGKSSLINALTGRKALARTSVTPGRTQEINFFALGGRLMLTDLPGYGFAQAPKDKVEAWTNFIRRYLKGRPSLRRALILIDSRHGLKDVDRKIMELMDDSAVNYQIVMTKTDKVKPEALALSRAAIALELGKHVAAHPDILVTSAAEGFGLAEVRAALSELAKPE
ncbi:MAG: YihA family ribosome biogenesis GTP-binding protein [Rhodospirillaceae bacterium]|nr:YihA family ribosome biogenesis GTP-binding protein [Rhodospirillaceae bacterium]